MTALGEWDVDDPATPNEVVGDVKAALEGLDVAAVAGDLVAATVATEIRRQVQRVVTPVVTAAVRAVLTPDRLEELRAAATAAAETELNPSQQPSAAAEETPALYYGSVDEFVREFICPTFRRNVGEGGRAEYRWSARWWESAEAIVRLEATWRAWEHLRLDPATGTSVWLRDHADHHLAVLMSPTGPWALSHDTAGPGEPLPYEPPPEGLFPDVRDAADPSNTSNGPVHPAAPSERSSGSPWSSGPSEPSQDH